MTKEVKIPMIVGIISYGFAFLICLIGVMFPGIAYDIMGASFLKDRISVTIFPSYIVFQIISIIMLIVFFLVMLKYKGSGKRIIGIVMIVLSCLINIVQPYIGIAEKQAYSGFYGAEGLSALGTLESFFALFTQPFTLVSTVFVIIAIGRYGVIKHDNNDNSDI